MRFVILFLTLCLSVNIFSKVNVPATTTSIAVDQIAKYFGDSTYFKVRPNNVEGMVTEYLWDDYEDESLIATNRFVYNQDLIAPGSEVVGFLKNSAVTIEINNDLKNLVYTSGNANQILKGESMSHAMNVIRTNINSLIHSGIVFGFDGNHRNQCGVTTDLLLIIDTKNSTIFGIDLNPCR